MLFISISCKELNCSSILAISFFNSEMSSTFLILLLKLRIKCNVSICNNSITSLFSKLSKVSSRYEDIKLSISTILSLNTAFKAKKQR